MEAARWQVVKPRAVELVAGLALLGACLVTLDAAGGPLPVPPPVAAPAPPALPPPPPPVAPPPAPQRGLAAAAVKAAESAAGNDTQLAVVVLDRVTGETAAGERAGESFYSASLSKVVVAVDVLDRRRLEGLTVTVADLDLVRRALGPSDDSAMSALWDRFDGAGAAARVSTRLGLDATTAPRDPSQWGEMNISAADTVRLWRHILDVMPASDGDLLVADMQAAPARADDGFDQAFGLLSRDIDGPAGPGAVAKQGWMCCFPGIYYMHSAGVVGADRRFVVAVLSRVSRGSGWEAARQELDRIAEAAVVPLRPPSPSKMPAS